MDKFIQHTGIGAPLRRSDVDTDQIIPASYLKRVTRTGFEDGLFAAWRSDPDFVLNQEAYSKATVLVAGVDFGIGSSREHAVWALMDYGFRVVISARFSDIFRNNCGKAGLLTATVTDQTVTEIWEALEANPGQEITVDLETKTITVTDQTYDFTIDDYTRYRLLNGLDDIALTLRWEQAIQDYEANRADFWPKTLPIRTND